MTAPKAEEKIKEAIQEELQNIKKEHGEIYHSCHEGYSILLEEVEETEDALKYIKTDLKLLWERIKNNFTDFENIDDAANLMMISMNAKHLAEESIQIAAVAEKFIHTLNQRGME